MSTTNHQPKDSFQKKLILYEQALSQNSYAQNTIALQVRMLKRIYKDEIGEKYTYSYEKATMWLKKQHDLKETGQIVNHTYICMRTAIEQFKDFCRESRLIIKLRREPRQILPEYFQNTLQNFINSLPPTLRQSTIRLYETDARQFLEYLNKRSILNLAQVNYEIIEEYIKDASIRRKYSMEKVLQMLKLFFKYFHEEGLIEIIPAFGILKPRYRRKPVLPHFTHDEVKSILSRITQSTSMGKRDYAIVITAVFTGLRIGDILDLQLSDIDWKKHEINVIQNKTKSSITLPLNAETGNALADYILNGRPTSSEDYVFVKHCAPYTRITGKTLGRKIIEKYYRNKCGFDESRPKKTFHSFRRSLGSWMSAAQTPLPLISEILGHTNLEATKFYLSYDNSNMSVCCLGFDGIPVLKGELL
jgi:integrase